MSRQRSALAGLVLAVLCDCLSSYLVRISPAGYSSTRKFSTSPMSNGQHRSFFQMTNPTDVLIESPSINSRRITAGIIIDAAPEDIWRILTDYDNLATHVPNLVQSYRVNGPNGGIRLFQEGAQKIIGFDFRASLTMEMREEYDETFSRPKRLFFKLVDSVMFSAFDGEWIVKTHSRSKQLDPATNQLVYKYKSLLIYTVSVRPKGPVPVMALEWRIREDVPINLTAMKTDAENLARSPRGSKPQVVPRSQVSDWETNETLGAYIRDDEKKRLIMRS